MKLAAGFWLVGGLALASSTREKDFFPPNHLSNKVSGSKGSVGNSSATDAI